MSIVEARHASTIFGTDENRHVAFEDTLFEVEAGAFVCIVASSGGPIDQRGERGDQET
jgi:ABC-type nitrate/sulfonate/bicarbonate transport system ATPase subunit